MAERSFGMEVKREPKIKSMKYEDFNDNEYLEKMVAEPVSYTHLRAHET